MNKPKVLVIIVTYNAMQWAERCFESLRKSSLAPDVFVVDNGSTDGTQSFIQVHYSEVIFLQSDKNLGFGKANNIGLQYALDHNYDYVYLLNQDAWVMPDTFEKLIAISRKYPDYGILSPFQMNSDLIHIDEGFASRTCSYNSNSNIFSDIYSSIAKDVYQVNDVMAAHWLLSRECIYKVGGFSPSFYHYGEDNNYIDRVLFKGLKVGITPSLKVVHDRGGRIESDSSKINIVFTSSIRLLSNPRSNILESFVMILYLAIRSAFSYNSFRPISNAIKIIFSSHCILKNRRISITENEAFLKT